MRKMIPTGRGDRVQFSIPDHEWQWFEMVCTANQEDAYRWLSHWVGIGARTSAELRECVREAIRQYIDQSIVDGFSLQASPSCLASQKRN